MRHGSATWRAGALVALMVAALAGPALAQSNWQTSTVTVGTPLSLPPTVIFDSQDRAQMVFGTGSVLSFMAGTQAGAAPNWTGPSLTGIGVWAGGGAGQAYMAFAGGKLYVGARTLSGSSLTSAAGVFDGTAWQPWTVPMPYSMTNPTRSVDGVVTDANGRAWWVVNTVGTTYSSSAPDTYGIYLTSSNGTDPATFVPVALLVGAAGYPYGYQPERALHEGGQAVLDGSGNLHTIQYLESGWGELLYATGPLAGPFQVINGLDRNWSARVGRPGIAVDSAGEPHIVYSVMWPQYGLRYLHKTATGWVKEWIDASGGVQSYTCIYPQVLIDRVGAVHVIYADLRSGELRHAVRGPAGWQVETIDVIGVPVPPLAGNQVVGAVTAAIDSVGGIGVAYWDGNDMALKYAYRVTTP